LEDLYPYYSKIDTIYRQKQNVKPIYLKNFGLNNQNYNEDILSKNKDNIDNIQNLTNNLFDNSDMNKEDKLKN
ncbi:7185_t:CDS:2, partial [Racocetra persica]